MYSCAECGLAVVVVDGADPIRGCDHDCAIVAHAEALLVGKGGMNQGDR